MLYTVDTLARRYGIAPWTIDLDDPLIKTWYRRATIFMSMEADRDEAIAKRQSRTPGG